MNEDVSAVDETVESGSLKIVLMRHGESFPSQNNKDHERSVTPSGISKVQAITKSLKSLGFSPQLFLCSNSTRSKQTHALMKECTPELENADVYFYGSLYTESQLDGHTLPHLMDLIRNLADTERHRCVLCLGHNKGWEEAASVLAGEQIQLNNGDAALFEFETVREEVVWQDALNRVGQKSGWRFLKVVTG
jgi:phosphohistidine phosphatase